MTLMATHDNSSLSIPPSFFPFTLFSSGVRESLFGESFAAAVEPTGPASLNVIRGRGGTMVLLRSIFIVTCVLDARSWTWAVVRSTVESMLSEGEYPKGSMVEWCYEPCPFVGCVLRA